MVDRYAILLDGAFVLKRIRILRRLKDRPSVADVLAECERIKAHPLLAGRELLRIYWYDARPATGSFQNPIDGKHTNLAATPLFKVATAFLDQLELEPDVALRLGELDIAPAWKVEDSTLRDIAGGKRQLQGDDVRRVINQKGVDLRIGLDMARIALRGLASVVVVVTGDSDIVPAFRFVRREGVRVYLDTMDHGVKRELKAHADAILGR